MDSLRSFVQSFSGTNATSLIREQWDRLSRVPGGKRLFSRGLGLLAPYTGSIDAQIEDVRKGYARVSLREHRSVRNHLRSIHAIALTNLVELTGNLAVLYSAPDSARMIVTKISTEYLKKARGTVTAECHCIIPESDQQREYVNEVLIRNEQNELVARGQLGSLIGPK